MSKETWKLESSEIGKSVGVNSGLEYKVHIAKILPLIPFGKAKTKTIAISKSCFMNASTCSISVPSSVKAINYINVPVANNSTIKKADHGTKLKIGVRSNEIDNLTIISKADKLIK